MGQCCGFVKTENGLNIHQAQFSREIEEHLDKLEKDRIIEAQETSSTSSFGEEKILIFSKYYRQEFKYQSLKRNNLNHGSSIGYHDGKEIGNHQSNLSNEIQKQRSVEKQLIKKEQAYEDYEVKVVEPISKDQQNTPSIRNNTVEKLEKYGSQQSKDLVKLKSQEKQQTQVTKQESLIKSGNNNNIQALGIDDINVEHLSNSQNNSFNYSSNDESFNNSMQQEETKIPENLNQDNKPPLALQPAVVGLSGINLNNQNNSNPPSPNLASSPLPQGSALKDSFINSGGRKSILMNTLAKKDDPNSGSKSLLSYDDLQEKKKEKKSVKLVTASEKRFDTDQRENTEKTTPSKPKGVLKKYDPNSSLSDADSPRTKQKKKVKFKESTFKKQSKKKKRD